MDLLQTLLWPLKWAVELILVAWHWIFTLFGIPPESGLIWILSIVGLVLNYLLVAGERRATHWRGSGESGPN